MKKAEQYKILVVDDEKGMCEGIMKVLSLEGYNVDTVESGLEAIKKINSGKYRLAFIDLKLPDIDGIEIIKNINKDNIDIVIITAHATVETAVSAMKFGASDYIKKPFDLSDIIDITKKFYLKSSYTNMEQKTSNDQFQIIYKSKNMSDVIEKINKIKDCDIPVLLLGESGTGKELIARYIHTYGNRNDKPFIAINCAAIPQELLESEFFGYEKGSFTGANQKKQGKFEAAGDGILFLDEIGDMDLSLQSKLLRVLESKCFEPIGSVKSVSFKARIIASTNQNITDFIKHKKFREDLYYRLNGIKINLPQLKERIEDIQLLIDYFKIKFENIYNKKNITFSSEAIRFLKNYIWPGNVRELKNVIESAILLSNSNKVLFPEDFSIDTGTDENYSSEINGFEKEAIINALSKNQFNRSLAAKALKISRKTLYNKMKKYLIN